MEPIKNLNVEPLAELIESFAEDLRRRASLLDRQAKNLRETGDLDEVSSAIDVAVSTRNMRLDLLVSRPIREILRAQEKSGNGSGKSDVEGQV